MVVIGVLNGSIETNRSVLLVVDGANFESVLVSSNETGLLTTVTGRSRSHNGGLDKDATSTVGVGTDFGVKRGEGNGVLIILTQVKVTREPCLDATVFTDQFNKLTALGLVGMIQPTAAIYNVIFLQNTESTSIWWSMGKDHNFPTLSRRVVLADLFEPIDLLLIDRYFMRSILGISKDRRSHTNQQSLVRNFTHKVRGVLLVNSQKHIQIRLVGIELVNTLQIVIATNDLVRDTIESAQKFRGHFVTDGRSSEQFGVVHRIVVAVFGFTQITETDKSLVFNIGILHDFVPLILTCYVIFHFTRINV
mmetsp:Transcript_6268/g.9229  ORF Transcript_6268/g.9229 Transcript_6268/m.9229 type:complete len:307 (-) Transcript_6268:225-1145(-)